MTVPVQLSNDNARMTIHPGAGGVISRCEVRVGKGWQALLASARGNVSTDPTQSSCFPMLPWCNRLSAGTVSTQSGVFDIPTNWHTTPMPVHGVGWLRPWSVDEKTSETVGLTLTDVFGPYSFTAKLHFLLLTSRVQIEARVINTGPVSLPFGVGFHPYFPRDDQTVLELGGDSITITGRDGLPSRDFRCRSGKIARIRIGRELRGLGVFIGGASEATVVLAKGIQRIRLRVIGGAGILLWAPAGERFFCLEPMSHPIDAFSRRPEASRHDLPPTQSIRISMAIEVLDEPTELQT